MRMILIGKVDVVLVPLDLPKRSDYCATASEAFHSCVLVAISKTFSLSSITRLEIAKGGSCLKEITLKASFVYSGKLALAELTQDWEYFDTDFPTSQ